MGNQFKILVLTDHSNHSAENSLYAFLKIMLKHEQIAHIQVASRGALQNTAFFSGELNSDLFVQTIHEGFEFTPDGHFFTKDLKRCDPAAIDLLWLRLPPPITLPLADQLKSFFSDSLIINDPHAIHITGSKEFLLNFPSICPPMKICSSVEDIERFKSQFPIVLKPFQGYGGEGIIRIDGNQVWKGQEIISYDEFIAEFEQKKLQYLGVQFLKNVGMGDKRIVVVDGHIMGASLRLPAEGSWLCNVAMGGSSNKAEITQEEKHIVEVVNNRLSDLGIVMYGIDTLVDNNGKRVLSEINTTSIGGLPQIAKLAGKPLVEEAVHLIIQYFIQRR